MRRVLFLLLMSPRSVLVPAALAALGTSGLAVMASSAVFTDSATVTGNTFTTGTVKLGVSPTSAAVTLSSMAPGDAKVGSITVSNTGSLEERYSVVSVADNADGKGLASQLQLTVKTGVSSCTAAGFSASGTVVYGPGVLGSAAGTKVIGDAAQGAQTGDRSLAALANEVLCLQVALPSSAGNSSQNATTTATLTFNAEQTANNA